MSKRAHLTQERLRELLHYDPLTGVFTRLVMAGSRPIGSIAGSPRKRDGYIEISVDDVTHYAHRLAFLYMTGSFPSCLVDHRDTDTGNNKWANLREATNSKNLFNRGPTRRNKTGVKGVYPAKQPGRFVSIIKDGGRARYLGSFDSVDSGEAAFKKAAERVQGEFARSHE